MPNCIIKNFEDLECPYFNNPKEDCWYDLEYKCNRINKLGRLNRLVRQARSKMFPQEK